MTEKKSLAVELSLPLPPPEWDEDERVLAVLMLHQLRRQSDPKAILRWLRKEVK